MGQTILDVVKEQTGNSGIYSQLIPLGGVLSTTILSQQDVLKATLCAMTANHAKGGSVWLIEVDNHPRKQLMSRSSRRVQS